MPSLTLDWNGTVCRKGTLRMSYADHFLTEIFSDLPLVAARRAELDAGWEAFSKLDAVTDKLEREAGIDGKTRDTISVFYRTNRIFFPAFALGMSPEGDREWAEYHDRCRAHVRDTYFAVSNIELRKRLIRAQHESEKFFRDLVQKLHSSASNDVAASTRFSPTIAGRISWWVTLPLLSGLAYHMHFIGLFTLGVVVWGSFVYGLDSIQRHAEQLQTNSVQLRQALVDLEDSAMSASVLHFFPYFFSVSEVESGIRETGYIDRLKATGNQTGQYPPRFRLDALPNSYRRKPDGRFEGGYLTNPASSR
jgi:hypothetical protein